jgi:hypothetical protein
MALFHDGKNKSRFLPSQLLNQSAKNNGRANLIDKARERGRAVLVRA